MLLFVCFRVAKNLIVFWLSYKILKEISICIIMCITVKVFHYEETELPFIKYKDEIWVKANAAANILRYKNTMKPIRDHVDPEDKRRLSELTTRSNQNETLCLERNEKNTIYINESGLYSLILRS